MISESEITELRDVALNATGGRWVAEGNVILAPNLYGMPTYELFQVIGGETGEVQDLINADFCAKANPAVIIELIDMLKSAHKEIEMLKSVDR